MGRQLKFLMERPYPRRAEIGNALILAAGVVLPPTLCAWLLTRDPISWLPKTSEADALLGAMLGAQAAIAALTLAVTLFVMQGVSTRRDVDDRIYGEYIRRSRIRLIFAMSIGAVFTTGIVLMAQKVVGDAADLDQVAASVRNLTPFAAVSFVGNLAFAIMLFERTILLANPEHWRRLRMDVNERDVRQAVRAYIGRLQRTIANQSADEPDWSIMFPDLGEGSANQAIRVLLDDARRAMAERRQQEFERSLNSIRELVTYAMDEMEKVVIPWGSPGSQAEWPPLRELGRNLYPFREQVIREGNRECIFELLRLDHWLVTNGIKRSCGELFTIGLNGYRWNYQITARHGDSEFHEMLRDDFSRDLSSIVLGHNLDKVFPYLEEIVNHQERILSDALHANRPVDYEQLHIRFRTRFSDIVRFHEIDDPLSLGYNTLGDTLARRYRIVLMGLAGRAVSLAENGKISNADQYLGIAREAYAELGQLATDTPAALTSGLHSMFDQWTDWEMQDHPTGGVVAVETDKYPQAFLAVRIMELVDETTPVLNLHGKAQRILDWFLANVERLERFVQDTPDLTVSRRRDLAIKVLQRAVRLDEIEEDQRIIQRQLSEERLADFKVGVREGARSPDFIERLFKKAGTFRRVDLGADRTPEERVFRGLRPKAYLMEPADDDRIGYMPFDGKEGGRTLAFDVVDLLCKELSESPQITVRLDSMDELLNGIELALSELAPVRDTFVVLAGDWGNVLVPLYIESKPGYEPRRHFSRDDSLGEIGRYQDAPIFRGRAVGERHLYVIEPSRWGTFALSSYEDGQDVRVEVEPICEGRAQQLLHLNPEYFSEEPDDPAKLRKLQAQVDVCIGVKHGFEVIDPTRARKIISDKASVHFDR